MDFLVDGVVVVGCVFNEDKKDVMVVFGNGLGIVIVIGVWIFGNKLIVIW